MDERMEGKEEEIGRAGRTGIATVEQPALARKSTI
jgi:hypothetical protein